MTTVSIDNLDQVKLYLRQELAILSRRLEESVSKFAKREELAEVEVSNLDTLKDSLDRIETAISSIELKPADVNVVVPDIKIPDIKIPEIKSPVVNVAAPNVTVKPTDVVLDLSEIKEMFAPLVARLSDISSKLDSMPTNQESFLEGLARESNRSLSNISAVFSGGSSGLTGDEYKELKKSSSNVTSVDDTNTSTTLLPPNNNRKGFIIFNNSNAILYVKLGATASTTSFTYRLTSYGTVNETNFRYTGIIDGIWASDASGNAQITELT